MRLDSGIGRKERLEGRSLPRTLSWNSLVLLLLLFLPAGAYAKQVTLAWDDPNAEGVVQGYKVYYRTGGSGERVLPSYDGLGLTHQGADFPSGSSLPRPASPATTVTCTVDGLSDTETYYFVVTAFNVYGESDASNETSTAAGSTASASSGGGGGGGCWITTAADGENVPQRLRLFVLIGSGGAVLAAVVGGRRARWRSKAR